MREKLLQHINGYKFLIAFHNLTPKRVFLVAYTDFKTFA